MPPEEFLFSAGGGFLFGAAAGYAIKKALKIAGVVVGLFVAGLAFLSYNGWIDLKRREMEIATRATLANLTTQTIHAFFQFRVTLSSRHGICTGTNVWLQEPVL